MPGGDGGVQGEAVPLVLRRAVIESAACAMSAGRDPTVRTRTDQGLLLLAESVIVVAAFVSVVGGSEGVGVGRTWQGPQVYQ